MNSRHLYTTAVFRLALGACVLPIFVSCSDNCSSFKKLTQLRESRDSGVDVEELERRILEDPKALECATVHIGRPASSAGGIATMLLLRSDNSALVVELLDGLLSDPQATRTSKIQSAWILWSRTGAEKYAKSLYDLVLEPGSAEVYRGRKRLVFMVGSEELAGTINGFNSNDPLDVPWSEISMELVHDAPLHTFLEDVKPRD